MGYIQKDKVKIHFSNKGDLMLKYSFINKNGDDDFMYIPIPDGYELIESENNEFGMKPSKYSDIEVDGFVDLVKKIVGNENVAPEKYNRLEELRKRTKAVDGLDFIKFIMENKNEFKDEIKSSLIEGGTMAGNLALERAFLEKIITPEEWMNMRDNLGIDIIEIGSILTAFFTKKERNDDEDEIIIVTTEDSGTYKNKEYLQTKFNITILNIKQAIDKMQKEIDKNENTNKTPN